MMDRGGPSLTDRSESYAATKLNFLPMGEAFAMINDKTDINSSLSRLIELSAACERRCTHNEISIAAYEFGNVDGPAIVFVHGWSQSYLSWHSQLLDRCLTDTCRLIAIDLRGHGNSPSNGEQAILPAMHAADLGAVLDQLEIDNALLVGWSLGGLVVMDYLAANGFDRINGVVFVASGAGEHPASGNISIGPALAAAIAPMCGLNLTTNELEPVTVAGNAAATIEFTKACTAESAPVADLLALSAVAATTTPKARLATLNRYGPDGGAPDYRQSLLPHLGSVRPVLIVYGEDDAVVRPEASLELAVLTKGHLLAYEGAGHSPMMERSQRFNADLLAFSRRVTAAMQLRRGSR